MNLRAKVDSPTFQQQTEMRSWQGDTWAQKPLGTRNNALICISFTYELFPQPYEEASGPLSQWLSDSSVFSQPPKIYPPEPVATTYSSLPIWPGLKNRYPDLYLAVSLAPPSGE